MGKPVIFDLAGFYRIGTFKGTMPSDSGIDDEINIEFYLPGLINSIFSKTDVIVNVPKDGLIGPITPTNPKCPWKDGIYFLVVSEGGTREGIEKIGVLLDRNIARLRESKIDSEITASLEKTARRLATKGLAQKAKEEADLKEIRGNQDEEKKYF